MFPVSGILAGHSLLHISIAQDQKRARACALAVPFAPAFCILVLGSRPKGFRPRIGGMFSDYHWASQIIPKPTP